MCLIELLSDTKVKTQCVWNTMGEKIGFLKINGNEEKDEVRCSHFRNAAFEATFWRNDTLSSCTTYIDARYCKEEEKEIHNLKSFDFFFLCFGSRHFVEHQGSTS